MRFDVRRADWDRFGESLTELSNERLATLDLCSAESVERMAETLAGVLHAACEALMPKKKRYRKSNPWWTVELTRVKRLAYRKRRAYQNNRLEASNISSAIKIEYRSSLREYRKTIKKVKQ